MKAAGAMGWTPGEFWNATPSDFWPFFGGWSLARNPKASGSRPVSFEEMEAVVETAPDNVVSIRKLAGVKRGIPKGVKIGKS